MTTSNVRELMISSSVYTTSVGVAYGQSGRVLTLRTVEAHQGSLNFDYKTVLTNV